MPGKAAKVVISERQQVVLRELSRSRTQGKAVSQRAGIILAAFAGRANDEISAAVGLERKQVGLWRRRWRDAWENLTVLECLEPLKLRGAIRETLSDAPRPGRPATFTAEQVCQILAVACEPPSLSGRPITHWTRRELRDEVVKRGVVANISESQVGRYLREAKLQPHRQKMWINTKEKDPEVFARQVEEVCTTYLEAPDRFSQEGVRTVCCDEMTGVQALERGAPDQPMAEGQAARQEFEYQRHGTTTLIGNWDVVQGATFSETIGPTRGEADFVAHIAQTVATDPDAKWVFVVDCLNIHWSAGLVEWIAEQCEPDRPLGKKRKRGRPEKPSRAAGVPVRPGAPHPVRLPAETQFVAEPNRSGVRRRDAKSDPPGQLHFRGRSAGQIAGVPEILQRRVGAAFRVDLHRQADLEAPALGVLSTPPPTQADDHG